MIDDGSSDGTLAVLQGYADRLAVLVSEPDRGIYDALNKCISRAGGVVMGFLHSDDLFADATVLSRIATAFTDPAVDASFNENEPVMYKPVEALDCFLRTKKDVLVLGDWMVRRQD